MWKVHFSLKSKIPVHPQPNTEHIHLGENTSRPYINVAVVLSNVENTFGPKVENSWSAYIKYTSLHHGLTWKFSMFD